MLRAVFISIALIIAGPAIAEDSRTLTVTGEGRVEAVPDMGIITIGVVSEARTAREAIADNSRQMADVLAEILGAGVAERDVQTSGFSVSPRWENYNSQPPRIAGFVAENRVTVRARDLATLGDLLDAATREGANRFDGLQFALQAPEPVEDAAREEAVAEARRKAALYAAAAGVTLGPIQSISEPGGASPGLPIARTEMSLARDAVPVAAGELAVTARVTLVYEIAE